MAKAKGKRKSTISQTRDANSREMTSRPMEHIELMHDLDIPKHLIPKGKRYYWASLFLSTTGGNVPAGQRIARLIAKGWKPVPVDRHPELTFVNEFDDAMQKYDNYIIRGGSMLMEIDEKIVREREMALLRKAQDDLNRTPGAEAYRKFGAYLGDCTNKFESSAEAWQGVSQDNRGITFAYEN